MTATDVTQELPSPVAPGESGVPPGYPRPFGQYLLLTPLAHGGMGEVFLASSRGSAGAVRLVVIKTLRPDLAKEPGYVTRFLDEARIVVQLQHANICQVFDVGKQDGAHYFAMEHIAGINVRRLLDALDQARKALPPSIALLLVAEVLEGLDAAHRHRHPLTGQALKVVHRDVSPHNVMVSFEGDVKLIDFGLAASEMKMEHTESQVVMGKIAYMSPEQARGEPVDASSDQFSAGIVLYELLAGERYYGDMTQREIWSTAGAKGYLPRRWSHLDDDVSVVLKKALAGERKERYGSCREFASALRLILQQRYPFADKAMVRSFVREAVAQELEASEATLRNLGTLAMTAMPHADDSRAFAPLTDPRTTEMRAPSEAGTGSTRTWMVFGKQRPSGWPLAVAATLGGIAIGVLAMLLMLPELIDRPLTTAVHAPAVGQASVPARVDPLPVAVVPVALDVTAPDAADAPDAPDAANVARADAGPNNDVNDVNDELVAAKSEGKSDKRRKKRDRGEKRPPPWEKWSEEKKIAALNGCTDRCVVSLRNVKNSGARLEAFALETCLERCVKR